MLNNELIEIIFLKNYVTLVTTTVFVITFSISICFLRIRKEIEPILKSLSRNLRSSAEVVVNVMEFLQNDDYLNNVNKEKNLDKKIKKIDNYKDKLKSGIKTKKKIELVEDLSERLKFGHLAHNAILCSIWGIVSLVSLNFSTNIVSLAIQSLIVLIFIITNYSNNRINSISSFIVITLLLVTTFVSPFLSRLIQELIISLFPNIIKHDILTSYVIGFEHSRYLTIFLFLTSLVIPFIYYIVMSVNISYKTKYITKRLEKLNDNIVKQKDKKLSNISVK